MPCFEIIGFCIYDDGHHDDCDEDGSYDEVDDENNFEEEKEEEEEYTRISECVGFSCRRL